MAKSNSKKSKLLKDIVFNGRHIYIREENVGGKYKRVIARIGDGFTKKEYKARPKGSIVAYRPYTREADTKVIVTKVKSKFQKVLGLRKGLIDRIKKLDDVSYNVRTNIIETMTTQKLNHQAQVGAKFEVRFLDNKNEEVVATATGWSFRTVKPISKLSDAELQVHLEQASRTAVMQLVNEIGIFSEDVFSVEIESRPMYRYDIGKKSGHYSKVDYEDEKENRPSVAKDRVTGIRKVERDWFNQRNKNIKKRFASRFAGERTEYTEEQLKKLDAVRKFNVMARGSNQ